jgi:hypothetical protein
MKIKDFTIEFLGIESSDYFQGYGLGPYSEYTHCAYGIGNTEAEALDDCLEMVAQQGFDIDNESEERIRDAYGVANDTETVADVLDWDDETIADNEDCGIGTYFHVGMKWTAKQ